MHAGAPPSCGIYCLRELRWKAQPSWPSSLERIGGDLRPLFALRSSRVPQASSKCRLLMRVPNNGSAYREAGHPHQRPRRATLCTCIQRRTRSSLHHLPVRRAGCQLGCLDVWQKHHEWPSGHRSPIPNARQGGRRFLTSKMPWCGGFSRLAPLLDSNSAWSRPRSLQQAGPQSVFLAKHAASLAEAETLQPANSA
jgi:hypothetical protein